MPAPTQQSIPQLTWSRLEQLLQSVTHIKVAVLGDLILDRYLQGTSDRLSPEAPVPVVHVQEEREVPGGAANVAANLTRMGASCHLIGVVGADPAGERLRQLVTSAGADSQGVITITNRPTTTKARLLAQGYQVVRIDHEETGPLDSSVENLLITELERVLHRVDALLIEDYDKGVLTPTLINSALNLAQNNSIPVILDPKRRNFFSAPGVTMLKPNRRELEEALAHTGPNRLDYSAAREQLQVEHLLVTMGAEGMLLVSAGKQPQLAPSLARDVYDVSGAGDTVTAWAGATLAAGGTAEEAAWLANLAAGVVVGKQGTATVSPEQVRQAWKQGYPQN